jgi:hypothetical protein
MCVSPLALLVAVATCRPLKDADMANWLYAGGGGGQPCSSHQVILILVAGLMPEELKDEAAAAQLAAVQAALLGRLAAGHPAALFYSNFFRWGMLHEEEELQQLVAAAEAGNTGVNAWLACELAIIACTCEGQHTKQGTDMHSCQQLAHVVARAFSDRQCVVTSLVLLLCDCCAAGELQRMAMLSPGQLQSQCCYAESVRRSSGMQWHTHSCAAFGWLNRLQAALCGDTDELLLLSSSWQDKAAAAAAAAGSDAAVGAAFWLGIATHLLEQALAAVAGCTAVLRQYAGAAGKPDKSADKQLLEAVRDLWANLADSCKGVAALQHMAHTEQQQHLVRGNACELLGSAEQQQQQQQQQDRSAAAAAGPVAAGGQEPNSGAAAAAAGVQGVGSGRADCEQQLASSEAACGHLGSDVPAAAPVTGHNMHLAAAVTNAQAGSQQQQVVLMTEDVLSNASWLQPLLQLMDAVCAYFGDESADLPAEFVRDFLMCAAAFSSPARVIAASQALESQALQSSRVRALGEAGAAAAVAWQEMGLDLQQLLQMPGNRKRKRKEL